MDMPTIVELQLQNMLCNCTVAWTLTHGMLCIYVGKPFLWSIFQCKLILIPATIWQDCSILSQSVTWCDTKESEKDRPRIQFPVHVLSEWFFWEVEWKSCKPLRPLLLQNLVNAAYWLGEKAENLRRSGLFALMFGGFVALTNTKVHQVRWGSFLHAQDRVNSYLFKNNAPMFNAMNHMWKQWVDNGRYLLCTCLLWLALELSNSQVHLIMNIVEIPIFVALGGTLSIEITLLH